MAFPVEVNRKEKDRLPKNGSVDAKIGNKTGLIWKIPGTSNRPVTLDFTIGDQGNKNNTMEVEIYRGEELNRKLSNKSFQAKTPINKSVQLPGEPGMVTMRLYQVKVGGMFGGFFEKTVPGMPGVSGKTHFAVNISTGTGGQPKEEPTTTEPSNGQRVAEPQPVPMPIGESGREETRQPTEVVTRGTGGNGETQTGGNDPLQIVGDFIDQLNGDSQKQGQSQPQTTYASSDGPMSWLEANPGIVIGGIVAVALIFRS